jgi:hypothetical protein
MKSVMKGMTNWKSNMQGFQFSNSMVGYHPAPEILLPIQIIAFG